MHFQASWNHQLEDVRTNWFGGWDFPESIADIFVCNDANFQQLKNLIHQGIGWML